MSDLNLSLSLCHYFVGYTLAHQHSKLVAMYENQLVWNGKTRPHATCAILDAQFPGLSVNFKNVMTSHQMQILSMGVVKTIKAKRIAEGAGEKMERVY